MVAEWLGKLVWAQDKGKSSPSLQPWQGQELPRYLHKGASSPSGWQKDMQGIGSLRHCLVHDGLI
jgi:hypothetical protein